MLIGIQEHCSALAQALESDVEDHELEVYDFTTIIDWLLIASSVTSVTIDLNRYNSSFLLCEGTREYYSSREKLIEDFTNKLIIFQFSWVALESTISLILSRNKIKKLGKIRAACDFYKENFPKGQKISYLAETVKEFRNLAQKCYGYQDIEKRFQRINEIGHLGIGLFTVYELRNFFAHGSINFPEPDEENRPQSSHQYMIEKATRISLLSIQMLFVAYINSKKNKDSSIQSITGIFIKKMLHCHLIGYNPNQMELELW